MNWYDKKRRIVEQFYDGLSAADKVEWAVHRKRCDRSLFYFIKECGGYLPRSGGDISPIIHKPILDRWQDKSVTRQCAYMPRAWFKSTCLTQWSSIWEYLRDNEIRILIPSEKEDKPSEWLIWIENQILGNARLRWLYPELTAVNDTWRMKNPFSGKRCRLPREGIYPESTISVIGIGGRAQGGHYDLISPDDLVGERGMESELVLDDAKRWFDNIEGLLIQKDPNAPDASRIHITGCLTGDSQVLMSGGGFKRLDEVVVGDAVVGWDGGNQVDNVVEAIIPQGEDETYTLATAHGKITGNGKHPFLMEDGRWSRLDGIKTEDRVVCGAVVDGTEEVDPDLAWFLGLMLGDGNIIPHHRSWAICVADGVHEGIRNRTIDAYEKFVGKTPKLSQHKQWMAWSKKFGDYLDGLGYHKTAKDKAIPKCVYGWSIDARIQFLRGFCDADGCPLPRAHDSYRIEIANEQLIKDTILLCSMSGVATGKILYRERLSMPPNSKGWIVAESWSVSLNFNGGRGIKELAGGFRSERVVSVVSSGKKQVYDLALGGSHNFIANGFVVHNTHWAMGDQGHYIQQNYPEYKWFIVPCLKDENLVDTENITYVQHPDALPGESNWPEMHPTEIYKQMMANPEQELTFWSQYMNNPRDSALNPFDVRWLRYYDIVQRGNEKVIVCDDKEEFRLGSFPLQGFVDPGGFSDKKMSKRSSRFALLVAGQPPGSKKKFVTYAHAFKFKEPKHAQDEFLKAHLFYEPTRPALWRQERYGQQSYIFKDLMGAAKARGVALRMMELEADENKNSKAIKIDALRDPMFRGEIYVQRGMKDLIGEVSTYPNGMTRDILDLMGEALKTTWKRGEKPPLDGPSPSSAFRHLASPQGRTGY